MLLANYYLLSTNTDQVVKDGYLKHVQQILQMHQRNSMADMELLYGDAVRLLESTSSTPSRPQSLNLAVSPTLTTGKWRLSHYVQALGATETLPWVIALSDSDILEFVEGVSATEYHYTGTCAMLPRPLGGVVDSNLNSMLVSCLYFHRRITRRRSMQSLKSETSSGCYFTAIFLMSVAKDGLLEDEGIDEGSLDNCLLLYSPKFPGFGGAESLFYFCDWCNLLNVVFQEVNYSRKMITGTAVHGLGGMGNGKSCHVPPQGPLIDRLNQPAGTMTSASWPLCLSSRPANGSRFLFVFLSRCNSKNWDEAIGFRACFANSTRLVDGMLTTFSTSISASTGEPYGPGLPRQFESFVALVPLWRAAGVTPELHFKALDKSGSLLIFSSFNIPIEF
ncbi:choline dehydrogenase [Colletotrichum cuscutae]|uniref:Choline dehydrogenase n=1 Tax=Colletotrichum cuscutae TaxID=1209917 RepID=A0AAI9VEY8_9PEZI|nr:choline dehydrogenase [Colletotrichum cuscutae]